MPVVFSETSCRDLCDIRALSTIKTDRFVDSNDAGCHCSMFLFPRCTFVKRDFVQEYLGMGEFVHHKRKPENVKRRRRNTWTYNRPGALKTLL